jgi:dipeptidyl aminopeptidase/acylaminoacyl peptidase
LDWVAEQLALLRPYAQSLNAWIASGYQDESRLLRGQALRDVLHWSQDKSLADLDYRFLSASQEWERREEQARLEAERLQEVEARLELARQREREQRKSLRQQRILLGIVTAIMVIAMALGAVAYQQYRQTAFSELKAIALSSEALYASNKEFDALLQAIKGKQRLQHLSGVDANLKAKVDAALQRVVLSIQEHNRLNGHTTAVLTVDFSPDGQQIATASGSEDKTVKLWQPDGTLLQTLKGHSSAVLSVAWNPNSNVIAASGMDGIILLWQPDGTLVKTLKGHQVSVWDIKFSPNGQMLASGSNDGTIRLWNREGKLLKTLKGHQAAVWTVTFSPDGQRLASGSGDRTVKLWTPDGTLLKTLSGHTAAIWGVAFSPDGSLIATASIDETVKLWKQDGTLLTTLKGHRAGVRNVMFHPHRSILASAGDDQTLVLWNLQQILHLDPLAYACNWVRDYLRTNVDVGNEDSQLCQHIFYSEQ